MKNLTWEQVKQGLVASYTGVKNTVTADMPAHEIERAFGELVADGITDKAIGGMAFDATLGMVVGYAGGKVVGWTAEKGWKTLGPTVALQAENFLNSQGLLLQVVPDARFFQGEMLGLRGVGTSGSVSVWRGIGKERIDIENPAPGKRPGQIHYQDGNNLKWYYDPNTNVFFDQKTGALALKSVQDLLNNAQFQRAIDKALYQYLGAVR